MNDQDFAALSNRLADMNRKVHAMPPRTPERSRFAMRIYDVIIGAEAKPISRNPTFAAYERAGARA